MKNTRNWLTILILPLIFLSNSALAEFDYNLSAVCKKSAGDTIEVFSGENPFKQSADVSRTMPVSGKFSAVQSAIYQIVLNAQNAGIKKAIPGNTFGNVHLAAVKELYDGLVSLKIISNTNTNINIEKKLIDIVKFFPHATSHWLGLDVHDIGIYATNKKDTLLKTGMVITVEPGLYFTSADRGSFVQFGDSHRSTFDVWSNTTNSNGNSLLYCTHPTKFIN